MTRYRRARHLVCYWSDGEGLIHNYRTGSRVPVHEVLFRLLDAMGEWTSAARMAADTTLAPSVVARALAWLLERGLIEQARGGRSPAAKPDAWTRWGEPAAFFHFGTRDMPFVPDGHPRANGFAPLVPRVTRRPVSRAPVHPPLPPVDFTDVLMNRRTWRRFGRTAASSDALTTVLALTFGVQRWLELGSELAPLRTSPSAGARQPLEAYVLVRHVTGVQPGLYHFDATSGALRRRRSPGDAAAALRRYLPGQAWYAAASCLVLMTAVLNRTAARYASPHAYRTVLIEAGHFAQTFCLTATALGLAPFCTAALADSVIERDLGVDPLYEPVIYAAGFGTRVRGQQEGRMPRGEAPAREIPRT